MKGFTRFRPSSFPILRFVFNQRDLGFRQGFVFRLSPLLGFNFRHYVEKGSTNNYKSRIRTLSNDHSQISSRPPKLPQYPQYRRVRRVPPFYKKRTFWIYSGGIGILFTVYYVNHLEVVPISNRRRFMDVTPKQEAKLAQQAYSEIMKRYRHNILPSWDHRTRFVRTVAQQIIRVSGMEDLKWEVHVIESPEKNAFVLPGGKIFVFTGILPIVENQHGLAAVLGHEIAHQVARHSAEKLSFIKIIIILQIFLSLFIDPGLLGNLFIELGIMMPFSRKCESEADYIGLLLMAQACYNPEEAIKMWKRMSKAEKVAPPQFLSTHPNHEARIKKISEWMPEALQKRAESDCLHQFEGFRSTTERFRPLWVNW